MKINILLALILLFSAYNLYALNKVQNTDCKVEIQKKDIILLCHDKKIIYKNLVINEMSVSTDFVQDKNNEFSLIYELDASVTKVKEKYNFVYSDRGIFLVYKEVLKYGKDGVMGNRIYFDAFDIKDKNYENLQSLGDQLEEIFAQNNAAVNYFDFQNKKFAKRTFKTSNEDTFINYPESSQNELLITNVEAANNLAFALEQKEVYNESLLILQNIVSQYPDRVVAYLNLADVEWILNHRDEAEKHYKFYLSLMKKQKKDLNKIPQRVYNRKR